MLITELKSREALLPLLTGKVFIINCHGCKEVSFPEAEAEELEKELWALINEYNSSQPGYRYITSIIVRKTPFIRNTTGKIKRNEAAKESTAA